MRRRHIITVILVCAVTGTGILALLFPIVRSALSFAVWRVTTATTIAHGHAVNRDTHIYFTRYGEGRVLVLLHGGLSSELDWLGEIPTLARTFQLIVISQRGHGRSTLGAEPLSYQLMAQDVVAVLDKLNIACAHVAGWSDGGNTALLLALDYPQRINRLVAISANFHPIGLTEMSAARNEPSLQLGMQLSSWVHHLRAPSSVSWSESRERVTQMWQRYPQLTTADLARIDTPTLVMVGANDLVDRSHASEMANALPRGRLLVIPDVGHAVSRDAPGIVTKTILQFLTENERKP